MDTTEKEQLAQEQLDELKAALKKPAKVNTVTLSNTVIGGGYNTSLSGLNYPNTITGGPYTISSTAGTNWATPITTNGTGQLKLDGENADIVINGVSLMEVLKDRLAVMIPNPALEAEWAELKELGDKYRALEADIKEKAEIWKKLNG